MRVHFKIEEVTSGELFSIWANVGRKPIQLHYTNSRVEAEMLVSSLVRLQEAAKQDLIDVINEK